jgi:predicted  nucleic acid-binding Zn-ribbon protein
MDRKAFMNSLSSQITEWQKELTDLSARAEQAGAKAKTEFQSQIKDLNSRLDDAQSKLKQIQAVGPDAWDDVREGFEKSWTEMRTAFKNALTRFKH